MTPSRPSRVRVSRKRSNKQTGETFHVSVSLRNIPEKKRNNKFHKQNTHERIILPSRTGECDDNHEWTSPIA